MSDYDPNFIPTKTFHLVGQKAVVHDSGGKILVLQRSSKSGSGGKWSLPGGALENEDAIQGILREIKEETALSITRANPYAVRSYSNEDEEHIVMIGYLCESDSEDVQLNWEHDAYQWLSKEGALELDLTEDGRFFIQELK